MPSHFSELLDKRDLLVGTWSQIDSADAVEILAASGFAFTVIDTEHTAFGLDRAQDLLRAAEASGMAAAVRIASVERSLLIKALDAGFRSVVLPSIRTADDVRAAIEWSRFGIGGGRGACPCIRAGGQWIQDWKAFAQRSDDAVLCIPLIETREAVANIDEIVALDGVKVVMLGPFDLSLEYGCGGDPNAENVMAAVSQVLDACRNRKVTAILPLFDPDPIALKQRIHEWQRKDVSVFMLGTDKLLLATVCRSLTHSLGARSDGR